MTTSWLAVSAYLRSPHQAASALCLRNDGKWEATNPWVFHDGTSLTHIGVISYKGYSISGWPNKRWYLASSSVPSWQFQGRRWVWNSVGWIDKLFDLVEYLQCMYPCRLVHDFVIQHYHSRSFILQIAVDPTWCFYTHCHASLKCMLEAKLEFLWTSIECQGGVRVMICIKHKDLENSNQDEIRVCTGNISALPHPAIESILCRRLGNGG